MANSLLVRLLMECDQAGRGGETLNHFMRIKDYYSQEGAGSVNILWFIEMQIRTEPVS